ncbi:MAG: S41 family peptidase [Ruminococcaceae bacterium]|nr:S41 family peptidase [Oscillospiraceae bacterium]
MNKERWIKILSYVTVAVLSATVTMLALIGFVKPQANQSKLDTLSALITNYFIGEKDQTAIQDAAANAMIESLGDRWSYYIPAASYQAYLEQMKNAYVGIGITVNLRSDGTGLDIRQVTEGGPSEEVGVLAGDVVVGVDGTRIAGMALDDIKTLIQGPSGTTVKLTLLRDGAELEKEVTRREIKTPVAKAQMLDGKIGLVTIVNFNTNCAKETIAAVEKLIADGAEKLIFDVRNNPGGYATELVDVLDRLLPEGKLFTTVDYAGRENTDMSDATCLEMPMAVLINGNSYSAAEFFAAAMREYDAAVVVGEKTSGKGYFQNTFRLPDGSAVALSVGKYFTPKGNSLAGVGLTPDVLVPVDEKTAQDIYAGLMEPMEDPQILAAIEALQ